MRGERFIALLLAAAGGLAGVVLGGHLNDALAPAIGWVVLACAVWSLTLRGTGRRLAGGLLVLAGVGMVGAALFRSSTHTGYHWGYAAAGLVVALGGLVWLLRAGRWSDHAARFDRGTARKHVQELDPWKALDAGIDPTASGSIDPENPDSPERSSDERPSE